jgi:hypothetical protein
VAGWQLVGDDQLGFARGDSRELSGDCIRCYLTTLPWAGGRDDLTSSS